MSAPGLPLGDIPQPVSPRRTRQYTKAALSASSAAGDGGTTTAQSLLTSLPETSVVGGSVTATKILPDVLSRSTTRLTQRNHALLLQKQALLRESEILTPRDFQKHATTVGATLVFAQEEAGTAVCVSADGLLLTCSHCVAETPEDLDLSKVLWLLFASGRAVSATCVAWDARRDLALLRVVAAQTPGQVGRADSFPFVEVASAPSPLNSRLICVGHPGSEDLEASEPGVKTNYNVLHLSTGAFRGYADGQDPQDNSEIGTLKHDCWTYWGHSGAPLLDRRTALLVGLHSSWDDETAMRRGVPLEAIQAFLREHIHLFGNGFTSTRAN